MHDNKEKKLTAKNFTIDLSFINKRLRDALSETFSNALINCRTDFSTIPLRVYEHAERNALICSSVDTKLGAFGVLASIDEIVTIVENQFKMIYEIAVGFGKEELLQQEILLGLFLHGHGVQNHFIKIHNNRIYWKSRDSYSGKVAASEFSNFLGEQMALRTVSMHMPLANHLPLAAWSYLTTKSLGEFCISKLSHPFEMDQGKQKRLPEEFHFSFPELDEEMQLKKILLLVNMMKSDGIIFHTEEKLIKDILRNSSLNPLAIEEIMASLSVKEFFQVDLTGFNNPILAHDLILDLILMAKIDEEVHPKEIAFLRSVAKDLGISENMVEELCHKTFKIEED